MPKTNFFTLDERKFIELSIRNNMSMLQISRHLKRHVNSIRFEIKRIVKGYNFYDYNAEKAQELADANMEKRVRNFAKSRFTARDSINILESKVSTIEEHIKIIFDIIKEKKS